MSSQVMQAVNMNGNQFPCNSLYDICREMVQKLLFLKMSGLSVPATQWGALTATDGPATP